LRLDVPKQKFRGLLLIDDLACGAEEVPGDLERTFYDGW
jgi:hypothetical protein